MHAIALPARHGLCAALLVLLVLIALPSREPEPPVFEVEPPAPRALPDPAQLAAQALEREKAVLAHHLAAKYRKPLPLARRVVNAAYREGERHGLSPLLLLAIVEQESGLRPAVVNSYGAMGLMQVVPRFHPDKMKRFKSERAILEPENNIRVGAAILAEYLKAKGGSVTKALRKYSGNATDYSTKVQSKKKRLRALLVENRLPDTSA